MLNFLGDLPLPSRYVHGSVREQKRDGLFLSRIEDSPQLAAESFNLLAVYVKRLFDGLLRGCQTT